ncbi:MAG: glycosyltransferase family 39 protein [Firmicutes bacterium]|nr:glycosyltransferase family 39 protein [Bacillota bacterium]
MTVSGLFDAMNQKHFKWFMLALLLIAGCNFFYGLNQQPVNDWDEARHGISAFEMNTNHNYIINTYQGRPDYWNLKPPLGLWLIALSYKIFGNTAFSLRFPSALASFLTVLLVALIALKLYNRRVAFLSGLILSTSFWFIFQHSGRTGDFDAGMAFLVTFSVFLLIYSESNPWLFSLSGLSIALGFLLKSFAAVQILGIMISYLIFTKSYRNLKLKHYVLAGTLFVLPVLGWALLRFSQDRWQFLGQMLSYDLLQRGTTPLEGHRENLLYFVYFLLWGPFPWSLFLIILPFFQKHYGKFPKSLIILAWIGFPLIMFSVAQTKCFWYINPLYPAMAVWIGGMVDHFLNSSFSKKKWVMYTFVIFFLLAECRNILFIQDLKRLYVEQQKVTVNPHSAMLSQSELFRLKVLQEEKNNR